MESSKCYEISIPLPYNLYGTPQDPTAPPMLNEEDLKKACNECEEPDQAKTLLSPSQVTWYIGSTPYKDPLSLYAPSIEGQSLNPTQWTFADAKNLIPDLQSLVKKHHYHMCLGGSVLNKGQSEKDLDLYFLPLQNGNKSKPADLLNDLEGYFTVKFKAIGKSYPGQNLPYIYKGKLITLLNKRIDVFVLGNAKDAEDVKMFLVGTEKYGGDVIELGSTHIEHFHKKDK